MENRFNTFDGNIPGNDYQFPVDLEGALGYNNQISLTVPMRMQDLKFWRDPLYSYGPWLSQGEESGCQAFKDNPGNTANWNNPTSSGPPRRRGRATWCTGADRRSCANLAKYAECDIKGTLAQFDTNGNSLVEYSGGHAGRQRCRRGGFRVLRQPGRRTGPRASFWYSGALAAAGPYTLLGNTAKATEMTTIANNIKNAILNNLWADAPVELAVAAPTGTTRHRADRQRGAAQRSGAAEYVTLPAGIVSGLNDFTIAAWVNPAANTHVVARVRLRHRHHDEHVPHRERRRPDRGSPSPPAAAAGSSG